MDFSSITKNLLYLNAISMNLSDKLDKVINPRLCTTTEGKTDRPTHKLSSPKSKPNLWISRIKQTSKSQTGSPKSSPKETVCKLLNKAGQTFLHQAALYGKTKIIHQLISEGADINQEDWSGMTPLLYAIKANQVKAVRELTKYSSLKIGLKFGHNHETALIKAVKSGHAELVKEIVKNRPESVGKLDLDGRSPLFHAILKGNCHMVADLVEAGSREKELIDYKGLNAIYLAIEQGEVNSVEALMNFSEFRVSQKICEKLLVMACLSNKKSLVQAVLPHLSTQTAVREEGLSPILISYMLGFREITYFLVEVSLNHEIDFVSREGQSLLLAACVKNDVEMVEKIVMKDCRLDLKDLRGRTALHIVCENGFLECLEVLTRKNLDVNAKDFNGNTPAMLAIQMNKQDVLEKLMISGAEVPRDHLTKMNKKKEKNLVEIVHKYSQPRRNSRAYP